MPLMLERAVSVECVESCVCWCLEWGEPPDEAERFDSSFPNLTGLLHLQTPFREVRLLPGPRRSAPSAGP